MFNHIVFACCLASTSYGARLHAAMIPFQNCLATGSHLQVKFNDTAHDTLKAFASFLLALNNPAAAFSPSSSMLVPTPDMLSRVAVQAFMTDMGSARGSSIARRDISELKIGEEIEGTVKRVTSFGAFLDIAASKNGLLHISEMSNSFISDPNEKFKTGDLVRCRVKNVNLKKEQIALTCKEFDADTPLRMPLEDLRIGQKVEGVVKRVVPDLGAFLDIGAKQDALLHITEIMYGDVNNMGDSTKHQPGDKIRCRIVNVKLDKKQIALTYELYPFREPVVYEPVYETGLKAAVVWLHGFEDDPASWAGTLQPLRYIDSTLGWRWLHLGAPMMKQPCYAGARTPGWGQFFSKDCICPGSVDYEHEDDAGWYAQSVEQIRSTIEELGFEGVPPERIVLGGYSQGAAIAMEAALSMPWALAGCVVLSGWPTHRVRKSLLPNSPPRTPFLICHGKEDDTVDVECAKRAARAAENAGLNVFFRTYEGMGHDTCPDELVLLSRFLHARLAPEFPEPEIDWEGRLSWDRDI